ncbi:MAG: sigma factor-like helix-turn-helix DNA-binding protein [Ilumatobacteraceae bacterium]
MPLTPLADPAGVELLHLLDADDREVLQAQLWDQFSTHQIALLLGISDAAARKRISRATQRLRERYEASGGVDR